MTTKSIKNRGFGLIQGVFVFLCGRKIENYAVAKYSIFCLRQEKNKSKQKDFAMLQTQSEAYFRSLTVHS